MKRKILFSIITPVLNCEKYIKKNILSIKNQSLKSYEHIIVDGYSKDNTYKIIQKNFYNKIKVIRSKDKNLWEAINKGIRCSQGKYIGILNADDYYYKDALKLINNHFNKNKKIGYIFGAVKKNGKILYRLEKKNINYKFNVYPSHSVSFFIKKNIQRKIGYYNTSFDYCSDYDLFFKLFNNKEIKGSNTKKSELIGFFRSGGISQTISIYKKIFIEFKIRLFNKQNIIYLIILFTVTILNILRNKLLNIFFKTTKKAW